VAFIERLDERLSSPPDPGAIIARWRELSVHRKGDPVSCSLSRGTVKGEWEGIDDDGRALVRSEGRTMAISAGDVEP
jgi:biotin-(acetyl-CoA carboxylase) ligase